MKRFIFGDSKHRRIDDTIIGKYNNEFNGTQNYDVPYENQILQKKDIPKYNFYVSPNSKKDFGVKNNEYSNIPYWYNFNKLSKGLPEHFSQKIDDDNYYCIASILCIIVIILITIIMYKFI